MPNRKYENILKVLYLNLAIMIYYSPVISCFGIVSQIFDQRNYNNLGNTSVFVIFFSSAINNILAPIYISKFKYKTIIIIASFGYLFFLSEGILVCSCQSENTYFYCNKILIFIIIIIGSFITGILASIFFLAQQEYISEMSNQENKGLLFGSGWALMQTSVIIGNVYSAFIIEPLGQFYFFILMSCICGISIFLFCFIIEPQKKKNQNCINEENNLQNFAKLPLKQQIGQMFDIIKTQQIRPLLSYMFSSGIIQSFEFGILYQIVSHSLSNSQNTNEEINKKTFLVNIVLGCFEFIGGILIGQLADRFKKTHIANLTNLVFESAIILSFLTYYVQNYTLCFFVGALWGMSDCSTASMNCSLISEIYGDDVRLYGIFNFLQCCGAFIGMLCSIVFKQLDISIYLLIIAFFQMITNQYLKLIKQNTNPQTYEKLQSDIDNEQLTKCINHINDIK